MGKKFRGLISEQLPAEVFKFIENAGKTAGGMGCELYLVGGIVRDLAMGHSNFDIDLMVEGDATELAAVLAAKAGIKPTIHKRFGTATLNLGEYRFDLATCRSETYRHPGALPEVKPGKISQDLLRRDFTVNAMALCINPVRFGELVDIYGGMHDLKARLIRVMHDNSFRDDATRIMRAIRYEQRLNFALELHTKKLLRRDRDMLDTISNDRLKNEVLRWLAEKYPQKILKRADGLGVLQKLNTVLKWDTNLTRPFATVSGQPASPLKIQLYLCLMIYNLKIDGLDRLLQRLNMSGGNYGCITRKTLELKGRIENWGRGEMKRSEIYFLLHDYPLPSVQANALAAGDSINRDRLSLFLKKLRNIKLYLDGDKLAEMGVSEGKHMGAILKKLLESRLNGEIRTKTDEVNLARKLRKKLK